MCTGGTFLEVKRGRGVNLTTHLHTIVPRTRMSRVYPLPLGACKVVEGRLYIYFIITIRRIQCGAKVRKHWPFLEGGHFDEEHLCMCL
jgi:hypothetical protein